MILTATTRVRSRGIGISAALATFVVTATSQFAVAGGASPGGEPAAQRFNEPPPVPVVKSAVHLAEGPRFETDPEGTIYSPLNNNPDVIRGHDNGQSALYDNGQGLRFSMWTFGDTALNQPNGDGDSWLAHTGARTPDLDMSDNISDWTYEGGPDGPREFIELTPEELHARYMAQLEARIRAWNDSVAGNAERARRATDWTVRDGSGGRWGVSPEGIHLGGVTLPPVTFPTGGSDPDHRARAEERERTRREIDRQEADTERRRAQQEAARQTRERRDAERQRERESEGN
jgi:hypothetical protein